MAAAFEISGEYPFSLLGDRKPEALLVAPRSVVTYAEFHPPSGDERQSGSRYSSSESKAHGVSRRRTSEVTRTTDVPDLTLTDWTFSRFRCFDSLTTAETFEQFFIGLRLDWPHSGRFVPEPHNNQITNHSGAVSRVRT